ncbi:MAG: hypothetical protein H7Z10_05735 [Gemmatimonadaceae bacterium]|nr:hypothetical protein [Acetobacteraceae bacterium]
MRLVKKTVSQGDTSAYHLFYADGLGSPGIDVTFFDWPTQRERCGTGSIVRMALPLADADALGYWAKRLGDAGAAHGPVCEVEGRLQLDFEEPEGARHRKPARDGGSRRAFRSLQPAPRRVHGPGNTSHYRRRPFRAVAGGPGHGPHRL